MKCCLFLLNIRHVWSAVYAKRRRPFTFNIPHIWSELPGSNSGRLFFCGKLSRELSAGRNTDYYTINISATQPLLEEYGCSRHSVLCSEWCFLYVFLTIKRRAFLQVNVRMMFTSLSASKRQERTVWAHRQCLPVLLMFALVIVICVGRLDVNLFSVNSHGARLRLWPAYYTYTAAVSCDRMYPMAEKSGGSNLPARRGYFPGVHLERSIEERLDLF